MFFIWVHLRKTHCLVKKERARLKLMLFYKIKYEIKYMQKRKENHVRVARTHENRDGHCITVVGYGETEECEWVLEFWEGEIKRGGVMYRPALIICYELKVWLRRSVPDVPNMCPVVYNYITHETNMKNVPFKIFLQVRIKALCITNSYKKLDIKWILMNFCQE